jgi:PAS domain S-box-containing protein
MFADLIEELAPRNRAEARLQLLSKVGRLAGSMDCDGVLSGVAQLSIPELADWCVVDVVENGRAYGGKVAHSDPGRTELAEQLLRCRPELSQTPLGPQILAGKSIILDVRCDEDSYRGFPSLAEVVTRLDAQSVMMVPFVVMGTPVAVASFVFTSDSGRRYGPEDLALAEELARRAAQIVENARLHEQLRHSEARFRVALEHSNIAVFEEDRDFKVRWVHNPRLGHDNGGAVEAGVHELPAYEQPAELMDIRRRVLATGERARTSADVAIGGERRHLLINFEPLRGVSGIDGILGSAVDITETKRTQEELAKALTFREQLMGVLGHDLRNPLTAVLGLASLLRMQPLPERTLETLKQIEQAGRRMNEMIDTLFDFTRLRFQGGLSLELAEVELGEIAQGVIGELQASHSGRVIELEVRGELHGRWDGGRIARVISNLVGNALTHGAPQTPIEVVLSGDDEAVIMAVTNRGATIPPENVPSLFEPFWQGPRLAESAGSRGLGLGLFIAHEIVDAHGGAIAVSSADGVTTFSARLPRACRTSATTL